MKLFHNISLRVFSKKDEFSKIEEAFDFLLPFDLVKEKIPVKVDIADSDNFDYDVIKIYSVYIDKPRLIGEFVRYLLRMLSPVQKRKIINNSKFIDDDMSIYLRFDKEALFSKKLELVDHGNCFHIKMTLAVYPKSIEKAREMVKNIFRVD